MIFFALPSFLDLTIATIIPGFRIRVRWTQSYQSSLLFCLKRNFAAIERLSLSVKFFPFEKP
jgi:hypothetical protein